MVKEEEYVWDADTEPCGTGCCQSCAFPSDVQETQPAPVVASGTSGSQEEELVFAEYEIAWDDLGGEG